MSGIVLTQVEDYLEEILERLDFSALNEFLSKHIRAEMTFEELVSQITTEGLAAINRENLTTLVFDSLFYELSLAKPMFIKMLLFAVLFSIVQKLLMTKNKYISDISFLMIYVTLMILLMQSFFLVRDIALEGVDGLLTFLNALIPTYAVTLAFSGSAVSGAVLYELAFILVYLVELLLKCFLSPMIQIFALVLFLNHLFDEDKLSKLAEFMEKMVGIVLKGAFGAVIGLGVVQSMLTPAKDRLASNVLLSGMSAIPGVGNMMGSAGEIVLSCGMLIKNSIGVVGVIVLFLIAVIPVLKIGVFWVMYQLLEIVLQPIADKRMIECVSTVARGCELYLKMILYSMMLFFILFSMVTVATSFIF
ncbi:MAG: stage III sporulation protein AE [Agathobacter sp.]|nr:stage III sporulation protein AE [Agathobacter sp.]